MAGARQRRAAEHGAPFRLPDRRQFLQARSELARRECRIASHRRAPVPRTHVLTDIAPEHVRPYSGALLFGNLAAQLNGEIRDAPRGIETLPGYQRRRGARLHAAHAGTATVRWRRVRRDLQRYQQLAEEKPRALLLIDQAGIPSDPPEARQARVGALQQGRGVDTDARFECSARGLAEQCVEARQSAPHDAVVILAPGVTRDPGALGVVESRGMRPGRLVKLAD